MIRPLILSLSLCLAAASQTIPAIDRAIETAIQAGELPGAVCLVAAKGRVLHRAAYGKRQLEPTPEAMTLDTIFDAASLTKVVATTTSVLKLLEEGRIRLADRVTVYLPEFQGGKSDITIRHLLTHYSGLRPDLDLDPAWSGYETGIRKALIDKPVNEPGTKFVYSDINFILLGEIVRRVSGKPLDVYAREAVFEPLGMTETRFNPPAEWKNRIAPTEKLKGETLSLRGTVHDETTRFMGGVAGHAGLFTTAADLAKFASMILRKGDPVLSPLTVAAATRPQSPAGMTAVRGLGWDIDSPYAGNRGDLFPIGSFGHTGFTGTSLWIDPASESYVILLANAVHPFRRPAITSLRGRVATIAAAYISRGAAASPAAAVQTGIDQLVEEKFAPLAGKTVGLITNHTGLTRDGRRNIDVMLAGGVKIKALFSPEHGIQGTQDDSKIGDSVDPASKLPVYSLYWDDKRKPNPANLKGIDTLVFDIQDVGARFYTYGCTMKNVMEVAGQMNIPFVVLDRPNPITGTRVEGPVLDPAESSFIGCLPIPLRHGLTIGELARFANDQLPRPAQLTVVPMAGWKRTLWFDETGLPWVNPSPNMRNLSAALLYPGVAMLEFSKNYSVGRGTESPLEQVGAPWIDGPRLAMALNEKRMPGVRAYAVTFEPSSGVLQGKKCHGVRFLVTDREVFDATLLGLTIAETLHRLYPAELNLEINRKLIGDGETIRRLAAGETALSIRQSWIGTMDRFRQMAARYRIYP